MSQKRYLISPLADALIIWGSPVWLWAIALSLGLPKATANWMAIILAIGSMGHHFPGFLRAYLNPEIRQRHAKRLFLVPPLLLMLSVLAYSRSWVGLEIVFILWGAWHGAMQVYGFGRIYGAKLGLAGEVTKSDLGVVLSGFLAGFLLSSNRGMMLSNSVYQIGLPIPTHGLIVTVQGVALFLFAFFLWRFLQTVKTEIPGWWIRPACLLAGIGHWTLCLNLVEDIVIGLALFEIFHDLQYLAIVWVFNRNRQSSLSAPEKAFFRGIFPGLPLYIAACIGYGLFAVKSGGFADDNLNWIRGVFIVSALMHFYIDGFVWKVHSPEMRRTFALKPLQKNASKPNSFAGKGEPWIWVLFAFSVLSAGYFQEKFSLENRDDSYYERLAEAFPRSWYARYGLGSQLMLRGGYSDALPHLRAATEIRSAAGVLKYELADAYFAIGELDSAEKYIHAGLAQDRGDAEAFYTLARVQSAKGRLDEAEKALRMALEKNPDYAEAKEMMRLVQLRNRGPAQTVAQ